MMKLRILVGMLALAGIAATAGFAEGVTTASLIRRLEAPLPAALRCPGGAETELWVLAGQSNMQGAGRIDPHEKVNLNVWLMTHEPAWVAGEEPTHRIWQSRMPAHRIIKKVTLEGQAGLWWQGEQRNPDPEAPRYGMGPGLPFARGLEAALHKPIGVIACAHGGTTMKQWNPDKKTSDTLYGAMLEKIRLAQADGKGGKLRGIVWYQGESEALGGPVAKRVDGTTETQQAYYTRVFLEWIDAVRRDTGNPELPIIYAQISRLTTLNQTSAEGWEQVRDAQRKIAGLRQNVWCVSALDLPMVDFIHLEREGQQRLGQRMAAVALREVYGDKKHGATPIEFESAVVEPPGKANAGGEYRVRVRFRGVNGKLQAAGRPSGFALRRPLASVGWTPDVHGVEFDPKDPAAVLLRVKPKWIADTKLIYGPGVNPYVNIVDSRDMPIPAFGPLPLAPPAEKR